MSHGSFKVQVSTNWTIDAALCYDSEGRPQYRCWATYGAGQPPRLNLGLHPGSKSRMLIIADCVKHLLSQLRGELAQVEAFRQ